MNDNLTTNEIRCMEAGHQLDLLIARHVLGWSDFQQSGKDWHGNAPNGARKYVPPYSTDISDAWQVVEKLSEIEGPVSVCWGIYGSEGNKASVMTMFSSGPGVVALTAPLAICRAALLAIMEDSHA